MKRGAPLRRTPIRAGRKPLRRVTRLRARGDTAYRRRERDVPRMLFTKTLPCSVITIPPFLFLSTPQQAAKHKSTQCRGPIEADHMGSRGIGQKAPDDTVAPLCKGHHSERHAHAGVFFQMTQPELRAWRAQAIAITQAAWNEK